MHDVSDVELDRTEPPPPPRPPHSSSPAPWIAAAAVMIAAAAIFIYLRWEPASVPDGAVTQTDVSVTEGPPGPLGPAVDPIDLPPLDESDSLVRQLVGALSSHPKVAAWLTTNGLIRNFVVSVENIASGRSPAERLRVLKPQGPYTVLDVGGTPVVDARSYNRYNDLAAAVDSINPDGAARLYSTLKPRMEDAHRDLGYDTPFDRVLETAIVRLLEAPAADGDLALVSRGALYQYNDSQLERLTAAQKQLVRMGPRNSRIVQRKLRAIGLALGIPDARLPRVPR